MVIGNDVRNADTANYGIYSAGTGGVNADVRLAGKGDASSLTMTVENGKSNHGIFSNPLGNNATSTVTVEDFSDVSLTSGNYVLYSSSDAATRQANIALRNNGTVHVSSTAGNALMAYAYNKGNADISVTGNQAVTIDAASTALYAQAFSGGKASVRMNGNGAVDLVSSDGYGMWAYATGSGSDAAISLDNPDGTVTVEGKGIGVVASGRGGSSSSVLIGGKSVGIQGTGDDGIGIYNEVGSGANGRASVTVSGGKVAVSGNAAGIANDGTDGTAAISVDATEVLSVSAGIDGAVADSWAGGRTAINTAAGSGRTVLSGGIFSREGAVTEVGLNTADSVWTGMGYDGRAVAGEEGGLHVTAGNGATWRVESVSGYLADTNIDQSYVSTWHSAGSSRIDMTWEAGYQRVDIRTLTGSGTVFRLATDIDAPRGKGQGTDQAVIHAGSGSHAIMVESTGKAQAMEQADYLVWHKEEAGATSARIVNRETGATAGGGLSFRLANRGQAVDAGVYQYKLATRDARDGDGTEWYLERTDKPSSSADMATSLPAIAVPGTLWWAQLSDLRKRLGEVRYGAQDGLWARVVAWEDETEGLYRNGFHQKVHGLNVGLDRIVRQDEKGMWLVGGHLKAFRAEQDIRTQAGGDGETDMWGASLYATWADREGCYADFVLSFDRYSQKMHTTMTDWQRVRGDYNTWGLGASIEIGRMFSSARNDEGWGDWNSNWFLEPQAQLSYYRVKGKDFTLDNGMKVSQDDGDSLTGRLGLVLGKKYHYGKNRAEVDKRYAQFYLEGGVKH